MNTAMLSTKVVAPDLYECIGLIPLALDAAFALVKEGADYALYDEDGDPFWVIEPQG